jgi:hypothetical protein
MGVIPACVRPLKDDGTQSHRARFPRIWFRKICHVQRQAQNKHDGGSTNPSDLSQLECRECYCVLEIGI